MIKVIFTIGVSASGKSTWALDEVAKSPNTTSIVCRDNIRHEIAMSRLEDRGYCRGASQTNIWKVWNWKWEKEVTNLWWEHFEYLTNRFTTIICADTNLNRARLDSTKQEIKSRFPTKEFDFEEVLFDISLEEAIKRDNARADGVGAEVIVKQWYQLQDFKNFGEKYTPFKNARKAIIVDIDGTLAHMRDRGAFEWPRVGEDELDQVVYHIVRGYYQQGYEIIIMSGRDSVCRPETEDWLVRNNVPYSMLLMRAKDDMRKDAIVKGELFWQYVAQKFNVEAVFDDRNQVVHFWRSIGLRVIHCGDPWNSF